MDTTCLKFKRPANLPWLPHRVSRLGDLMPFGRLNLGSPITQKQPKNLLGRNFRLLLPNLGISGGPTVWSRCISSVSHREPEGSFFDEPEVLCSDPVSDPEQPIVSRLRPCPTLPASSFRRRRSRWGSRTSATPTTKRWPEN